MDESRVKHATMIAKSGENRHSQLATDSQIRQRDKRRQSDTSTHHEQLPRRGIYTKWLTISSAGGVMFAALDEHLMLRDLPGVFCAGEMLDWEAPTGGYLLTACFASGRRAGLGALRWLAALPAASPGGLLPS